MFEKISEIKHLIDSFNLKNESGQKIILRENENMSYHTTFKIGGKACLYAIPSGEDAFFRLISVASEMGMRYFILGNGSNLLVDDAGFDGMIISTEGLDKIEVKDNVISVGSGVSLNSCAASAKANELSGLENLYGIPGSMGGALFMNAGAYGSEMSDVVLSANYIDPLTKKIVTVNNEEIKFRYRGSIFKDNGGVILSAVLQLNSGDYSEISEKMNECRRKRAEKQPLEFPSAGSTFKRYPGYYTGQLIEEAGLKGFSVGGAKISEKHAGFIINTGKATSYDVLGLIDIIKNKIYDTYKIEIECEIIYLK